jgi:hypothetical protein
MVRIHQPQMPEAEVLYGTRRRSDVQRIARIDQDDAQVVGKRDDFLLLQVRVPVQAVFIEPQQPPGFLIPDLAFPKGDLDVPAEFLE